MIGRLERRGVQLASLKLARISRDVAEHHYAEHRGKPFYEALLAFICSGPVVAMVWEGANAVATVRALIGATNPAEAAPGTIRGDLATGVTHNLAHGSDSPARAEAEIELFFKPDELLSWERTADRWILE